MRSIMIRSVEQATSERTGTMRFAVVFLVGLVAVTLAGCDSGSVTPPSGTLSPSVATTEPFAPAPSPPSRKLQASARSAATQFYNLYLSEQFAASWDLLAPAAKHQIRQETWIKVHSACASDSAKRTGTVKSVTVFGHAAIVTMAITGATSTTRTIEAVFNYADGGWGYSPGDLGVYKHGSVAADVAAARAVGFCAGWKNSML